MPSYVASKTFVSFFSKAVAFEEIGKSKIDYLCLQPAGVSTNMMGKLKNMPGFASTYKVVKATLRDLGRENYSSGCFEHDVQVQFMHSLNLWGSRLPSIMFSPVSWFT